MSQIRKIGRLLQTAYAVSSVRDEKQPTVASESSRTTFVKFKSSLPSWFWTICLAGLIIVFSIVWIRLALLRYFDHEANAVDLGYISQIFYNTAHGSPFRLTVYDPQTGPDRYSNYFYYHAEPIIFVLAPLYGFFNQPAVLLIFQVLALSLGALPAYWLGRDCLNSRWAGLIFATLYLLAPSLQAALLSDYHNVALAAPFFMFAIYFGWRKQSWLFVIFALLAISTKEDVTLLGAMLGLYAFFIWRLRWAGAVVTLIAVGWFITVLHIILPYFGADGAATLYYRYPAYGKDAVQIATTLLTKPIYVWHILPHGEIFNYITGLWQQSGGLAILNPFMDLVVSPVVLINVLSNNSWQHSGGAHYSVALVPFLIAATITGFSWLLKQNWWDKLLARYKFLTLERVKQVGLALVLLIGAFYYVRASVGPLTLHTYSPQPSQAQARHEQLLSQVIAQIPADASVSAQNNLLVFVSQRHTVFLYPRLLNNEEFARYILLDITADPFPQLNNDYIQSVKKLLSSPDYGLIYANNGYLLFERGVANTATLATEFYTFTNTNVAEINFGQLRQDLSVQTPNNTEFAGGELKLLGTSVVAEYQIGYFNPPLEVTTYWQVIRPPDHAWQITYNFSNDRGEKYSYNSMIPTWKPTSTWQAGQVITVRDYPIIAGRFQHLQVTLGQAGS